MKENAVIDCLMNHRSIRRYSSRPIDDDTLHMILRAGTRGATGGNLQLYTFVVIDDRTKIEKLKKIFPGLYDAPAYIIALADQHRIRRWFEVFGVDPATICSEKARNFYLALWDAYIALQNAVVAAESLGLGTCYIGGVLSADLTDLLCLPRYAYPAGMICLGYPEETPDLSMRLPLEAVVHRNEYRVYGDDDIRDIYRERNAVWDRLPENIRERLTQHGLDNIPKAVARRKFRESVEQVKGLPVAVPVGQDSAEINASIERSGFDLSDRL